MGSSEKTGESPPGETIYQSRPMPNEKAEECCDQNSGGEETKLYRMNPDIIIRNVAGEALAVPTGKLAYKLNALITLTEGGLFLLEHLEEKPLTKADLIRLLENEYDVATETAAEDVSSFLEKALENDVIY